MRNLGYTNYMATSNGEKLLQMQAKFEKYYNQFNSQRKPRANALIIAGVILLGGFMTYNFVGRELTQVASKSYRPAVVTPTPSVSPTPTIAVESFTH